MLSIGNKKYRNLQEQVAYNTECIKKLDEYLDGITIEDKLVVIESDSGTFTDEELVILSAPLAFISNGSRVWMKDSETLVQFVYKAIDIKATEIGNAYFEIGGSKIVVNRETGAYNTSSDTIITTYNKTQIDSIISNIMTLKADKSELSSGLALKANIAGQAFTGGITAPSIIEDMDGYAIKNIHAIVDNMVYASVCKNGNKITFVIFGTITPLAQTNYNLAQFTIPETVGLKLYPFTSGALTNLLEVKNASCFTDSTSITDAIMRVRKESNSTITFELRAQSLTANTQYNLRFECTFLLSDNLAS